MGFEAARLAIKSAGGAEPDALWFSTVTPAYVDKTNATTIHAALRLDDDVGLRLRRRTALGVGHAPHRAGPVGHRARRRRRHPHRPARRPDEAAGGDAASALLVGDGDDGT